MVQKLSTFLGTSLVEAALDSAATRSIVLSTTIPLDSNTSGDYVRTLTNGGGMTVVPGGTRNQDVLIRTDSAVMATLNTTQTLTNKTFNLTNNTLTGNIGQFNAALSGANFATINGIETLTNKTISGGTISAASIEAGSITDISTFGLRDVSNTNFETRIISDNDTTSFNLTADRSITIDVKNADRNLFIAGDLSISNAFATSGGHGVTLNTTGTTDITLPASGFLRSAVDSGGGVFDANIDRSAYSNVVAGTYGSATHVPKIRISNSGFVDSIGIQQINSVTSTSFDSDEATLAIGTASGSTFNARIGLAAFSTTDLSECTN